MTPPDLDEAIAATAGSAILLPEPLANWWTQQFLDHYVDDPDATWWWSSLSVDSRVLDYGMGDGLAALQRITADWGPSVLIASDEKPRPWICVLGMPDILVELVRDVRNFEFAFVEASVRRFVVDTHLNKLIIHGA
jgi:hypothetical protein